jgi:hypothetical protein
MSVQDIAQVAASMDGYLLEQLCADGSAVPFPATYSIFRAGQLAATYRVLQEHQDHVEAVAAAVARRAGVATVTFSVDARIATVDRNPHTGQEWVRGSLEAFMEEHPGDLAVVDALITTAADREGNSAICVAPYLVEGGNLTWLPAERFDNDLVPARQHRADQHAQQMLARSQPFLDPGWRSKLDAIALSGKQEEEAVLLAADLAAGSAASRIHGPGRRSRVRVLVRGTRIGTPPGRPHPLQDHPHHRPAQGPHPPRRLTRPGAYGQATPPSSKARERPPLHRAQSWTPRHGPAHPNTRGSRQHSQPCVGPYTQRWEGAMVDDQAADVDAPEPFDPAVFQQSRWWVHPDGTVYAIARLRRSERRTLLVWLRAHADHFYLQAIKAELRSYIKVWESGEATGQWPPTRFEDSELLYRSASEWLENTELVRALRERRPDYPPRRP